VRVCVRACVRAYSNFFQLLSILIVQRSQICLINLIL